MRKILITAALPYANNIPHLGTLIGCVLSADVFARYNRLKENKCIYICGTDEYGTATEIKALEEGISPKELCDRYYKIHKQIYEWFNISFDIFGRTSTQKHTQLVQSIFLDLYKNGYIFEKEIEQPFDQKLGIFLADRFIVGQCPYCGSKDAKADQCDVCGRLLDYSKLIDPVSTLSKTKPILKKSKHLFLDLPKIEPEIKKFVEQMEQKGLWSKNTIAIAKSWLENGLEPRAITRDLQWGVKVPLQGWENKVFYVWFDAPIGYISITANLTEQYMEWWTGEDVEHYEFIGKDNVPFHAIIFPATLIGTKKRWVLPYFISSTEFLNYEGGKFSKSKKIGVFGDDAIESGLKADVWRYYLLINRPETSDTTFTWEDFQKRINNELVANLANLVNRTLVFIERNFEQIIPSPNPKKEDNEFFEQQKIIAARVDEELEKVNLRKALETVMEYCANANKYFQTKEPWKKIKTDKPDAQTTMFFLINSIFDLAILIEPFLPNTTKEILKQLNYDQKIFWKDIASLKIKPGHKISKPKHLFEIIDEKKITELKERFNAKKEQAPQEPQENQNYQILKNLDLEVGRILEVKKHPNADNLYIEKIQLQDEQREIVSGLVKYYTPEELVNKKCIIVKNLKPKKLRGIESKGMLLAAKDESNLEVLEIEDSSEGQKIKIEGIEKNPKLKEITIEEFLKIKMFVKNNVCYAENKKLLINGKEIRTKKIKDGQIS